MSLGIIIPTKGKTEYLFNCLKSIKEKTKKTKYHIYVADTGSSEEELEEMIKFFKAEFGELQNLTLIKYTFYNFARINNHVIIKHAKEDFICFCNNDIELQDNCIDRMYKEIKKNKTTGTVGCRLLFPDGRIQHAGQVAFTHRPEGWPVPEDKLEVTHRGLGQSKDKKYKSREQVMGNTAALMMVRRDVFGEAEGFNEGYEECFEDVEFNMRVMMAGYKNIYLDDIHAIHHESVTRTKSRVAMQRLERDYVGCLYPFWTGLHTRTQKLLTDFKI